MTRIVTLATLCALLPGVAAAHPDHASGGDFGLLHFVSDPFHVGLSAAALLLFVAARRSLQRWRAASRRSR